LWTGAPPVDRLVAAAPPRHGSLASSAGVTTNERHSEVSLAVSPGQDWMGSYKWTAATLQDGPSIALRRVDNSLGGGGASCGHPERRDKLLRWTGVKSLYNEARQYTSRWFHLKAFQVVEVKFAA